MNVERNRVPKGVPEGGQFSGSSAQESPHVTLDAFDSTQADFEEDLSNREVRSGLGLDGSDEPTAIVDIHNGAVRDFVHRHGIALDDERSVMLNPTQRPLSDGTENPERDSVLIADRQGVHVDRWDGEWRDRVATSRVYEDLARRAGQTSYTPEEASYLLAEDAQRLRQCQPLISPAERNEAQRLLDKSRSVHLASLGIVSRM